MSEKSLAFFDWRGGISRIQYFRGNVVRTLILMGVIGANYIFSAMFGWDVWNDIVDEGDAYLEYLKDPLVVVSFFIIFVPWDLRRMKDAGISWWWIVPIEILFRLPDPPAIDGADYVSQNAAHFLVSFVPHFVFYMILLFKPGQAHRDFLRDGRARRGSGKVTFSN